MLVSIGLFLGIVFFSALFNTTGDETHFIYAVLFLYAFVNQFVTGVVINLLLGFIVLIISIWLWLDDKFEEVRY